MKRIYFYWIVIGIAVFVGRETVWAKTEAVVGIPMIQARLSMDHSHNIDLDNSQKVKSRLIIT